MPTVKSVSPWRWRTRSCRGSLKRSGTLQCKSFDDPTLNISYLTSPNQAVSQVLSTIISSSSVGDFCKDKRRSIRRKIFQHSVLIRKYQQFLFLIDSRETDQLILFLCYLFYVQLKASAPCHLGNVCLLGLIFCFSDFLIQTKSQKWNFVIFNWTIRDRLFQPPPPPSLASEPFISYWNYLGAAFCTGKLSNVRLKSLQLPNFLRFSFSQQA